MFGIEYDIFWRSMVLSTVEIDFQEGLWLSFSRLQNAQTASKGTDSVGDAHIKQQFKYPISASSPQLNPIT